MLAYGKIEVTCTPQYYRRAGDDDLIPAEDASSQDDFNATGIVLRIETPKAEAGKMLSFHFDFPEKWNHWYKPGLSYAGAVNTNIIGAMNFLCDPGLHEIASNLRTNEKP